MTLIGMQYISKLRISIKIYKTCIIHLKNVTFRDNYWKFLQRDCLLVGAYFGHVEKCIQCTSPKLSSSTAKERKEYRTFVTPALSTRFNFIFSALLGQLWIEIVSLVVSKHSETAICFYSTVYLFHITLYRIDAVEDIMLKALSVSLWCS